MEAVTFKRPLHYLYSVVYSSVNVQENFPVQPVMKAQRGSKVYLYSFFNLGAR